jgi:hypothetical protein
MNYITMMFFFINVRHFNSTKIYLPYEIILNYCNSKTNKFMSYKIIYL